MYAKLLSGYVLAGLITLAPVLCCAASLSLYERLGGGTKLSAIVDDYVQILSTDRRTQRSFVKSDLKRIKRMLTLQLCDLTGGPCHYTGDSMREVHAGHHIDDSEFLSGVELLRSVLVRDGVALRERNELLALLAPMKSDVVEK